MLVRDVMKSKVETVETREPAESALKRMQTKRIRHLVVLTDGQVVGVLSERDIGGPDRQSFRLNRTVGDVMTPYAVKARPEMSIRQAANLMRGWTIGCLPVVSEGELVGIITVSDLLELLGKGGAVAAGTARPASAKPKAPVKKTAAKAAPKKKAAARK